MNFIVIPSLNPTEELPKLIDSLGERERIIVVDDGSSDKSIFDSLRSRVNVFVLTHPENRGKGAAIKTAAAFIAENFPAAGFVTADDDGQHTAADIKAVRVATDKNPAALILGVRNFSGDTVPIRSKMGNFSTFVIFKLRTGKTLRDTQTGLRGIPAALVGELLTIPGNRFDFEITMLTQFADCGTEFICVPISTVYISGGRKSNYRTFRDSVRVIRGMLYRRQPSKAFQFSKFGLSGILSAGVDIGLYYILLSFLPVLQSAYIARLISGVFNFTLNRNLVFQSNESPARSAIKYIILFAVQLVLTANLTDFAVNAGANELLSKIAVDLALFTVSFVIQRKIVFRKKQNVK
jgi:glycosyltransferase involved in cell wall biosynthesis